MSGVWCLVYHVRVSARACVRVLCVLLFFRESRLLSTRVFRLGGLEGREKLAKRVRQTATSSAPDDYNEQKINIYILHGYRRISADWRGKISSRIWFYLLGLTFCIETV